MVEYESLLERDAIYLFEHSPGVVSFQEQPEVIMYEYENKIKKYYPDFSVTLNSGIVIHIEIKPQSILNQPLISGKFEAIIQRYKNHSAQFLILTELTIRKEPLFSNLKEINNFKKYHIDIEISFTKLKKFLIVNDPYSVKEISEKYGKTEVLIMLANRLLFCDLHQSLWADSNILRTFKEDDDDTLFF